MLRLRKILRAGKADPESIEERASASDAQLVHASRQGDKRAFVEIVARHQAKVCGIALGILGDFAASEDAGPRGFFDGLAQISFLARTGTLARVACTNRAQRSTWPSAANPREMPENPTFYGSMSGVLESIPVPLA